MVIPLVDDDDTNQQFSTWAYCKSFFFRFFFFFSRTYLYLWFQRRDFLWHAALHSFCNLFFPLNYSVSSLSICLYSPAIVFFICITLTYTYNAHRVAGLIHTLHIHTLNDSSSHNLGHRINPSWKSLHDTPPSLLIHILAAPFQRSLHLLILV